MAERFGRAGADGMVTLAVPVSVRVDGDTRANALDGATIRTDPSRAVDDLTGMSVSTKEALVAVAEQSHNLTAALPTPALRRAIEGMLTLGDEAGTDAEAVCGPGFQDWAARSRAARRSVVRRSLELRVVVSVDR